ncbi:unnamed protein product, partial [Rhizoctonia solani]
MNLPQRGSSQATLWSWPWTRRPRSRGHQSKRFVQECAQNAIPPPNPNLSPSPPPPLPQPKGG